MPKIILSVVSAGPTAHGTRLIAESMYAKGKAFLGAAILLRDHKGNEFVVLHLVCQGIEAPLKGLLLVIDYDKFKPELKKLNHNLLNIVNTASLAAGLRPLRSPVRTELEGLNRLYSRHFLRYGSGYDILVDPTTISSKRVLRRVGALLRLVRRRRRFW
jgi:hypothetical protein